MPNEPTYSQIEAAAIAMYRVNNDDADDWTSDEVQHPQDGFVSVADRLRRSAKAALIAAQQVDRNIYGDMHFGFSCDGVTLQTNSAVSRDRVVRWHHLAETTIPYHEKHTIPELIRLRARVKELENANT